MLQGEAHPIVIHTRAVVDQLVAGLLVVPGLDGIYTDLQLQAGRHAVHGLIGGGLVAVGVGMQIDEAGRGDESLRFYRLFTRERLGRDRGDLVADDPDVPNGIQPCLRIDRAGVEDYDVVRRVSAARAAAAKAGAARHVQCRRPQ